jgi:hypothetical protein
LEEWVNELRTLHWSGVCGSRKFGSLIQDITKARIGPFFGNTENLLENQTPTDFSGFVGRPPGAAMSNFPTVAKLRWGTEERVSGEFRAKVLGQQCLLKSVARRMGLYE